MQKVLQSIRIINLNSQIIQINHILASSKRITRTYKTANMSLFQKSVLNKYLKTLDDKKVKEAYQKFVDFFHNPTIIQNIRDDKEEQFQYGFLQKLFDEILDYTINPNPDYNLTTELKNLKGAKKADGAILKDGKAVGVIELKGTKTKELSKITDQAFGYKNNHPTCIYIITSNFEKLRFYINDAVEYLDFDLFTLKEEEFKLLYLCLHKDHILSDLPQRIKKDSTLQEENVTKKLYKDYSAFKNALFNDLVKNNPDIPKLTLFKKSQKLIDRFLFIFFAEDKGLLPPNSISKIVKTYDGLEELDNYKPLYEVFQQYFGYINAGRPARGERAEIFAFNGGLFAPDEMLDKLKISDGLLQNHTLTLSGYDFESEVDVNILGHIFEHSLNEIDEMTAEIEGQPIDKNKTKRKKDGVFYTPKYITKYIVDNTVGKLCEAHKTAIDLQEDEYKPKRNKATKKRLLKTLEDYRKYLLSLTICDPACGSGAFLNQALDYLIKEHRYIDELQTKLLGGSFVLSDITNDILEQNIYGVDINEESVDIARLSMWLRSAKKGRALTTLSSNIKCGNSLIDDKKVAGEKAFNWKKEFPEVFKNGGFDVVIGNPPYGAEMNGKEHLKEKFKETSFGNIDSYKYFYQKGIDLLKQNGNIGYITPDSYLEKEYFRDLRLYNTSKFESIVNIKLGDDIFDEVNLPTSLFFGVKKNKKGISKYAFKDFSKYDKNEKQIKLISFPIEKSKEQDFEKSFIKVNTILKSIDCFPLIEKYDQVFGVKVYQKGKGKPKQTQFEKENDVFISKVADDKFNYPFISQGIYRYEYKPPVSEFIKYGVWLAEPRKPIYFDEPKIIIREIVNPRVFGTYVEYPSVVKNIAAVIIQKEKDYSLKYLLGLINS